MRRGEAGAALEHGDDHRQPLLIEIIRQASRRAVCGLADERLHFDEHRPRSDDRSDHARTAGPLLPSAEKDLRWVGDLAKSGIVHRQDADLVDRTEAIFIGAKDAVFAAGLAFEVENRVDEMFEQPRSRDCAVFRDVAYDKARAARTFGVLHERRGAVANLRDASRVRVRLGQPNRLNRIDDQGEWMSPLEAVEHRAQIRLGIDEQCAIGFWADRAVGTQSDLCGRLLAAHVHDFAMRRQQRGNLQEQR